MRGGARALHVALVDRKHRSKEIEAAKSHVVIAVVGPVIEELRDEGRDLCHVALAGVVLSPVDRGQRDVGEISTAELCLESRKDRRRVLVTTELGPGRSSGVAPVPRTSSDSTLVGTRRSPRRSMTVETCDRCLRDGSGSVVTAGDKAGGRQSSCDEALDPHHSREVTAEDQAAELGGDAAVPTTPILPSRSPRSRPARVLTMVRSHGCTPVRFIWVSTSPDRLSVLASDAPGWPGEGPSASGRSRAAASPDAKQIAPAPLPCSRDGRVG